MHVSRLFLSVTALKRRIAAITDIPLDLLLTENLLVLATEQDINKLIALEQIVVTNLLTDDDKRISTEQDPNLFLETEQYLG
jgi:hypothetical protein